MESSESLATVTRDGKPAALKSLVLVLFFAPIGYFMGGRIASALGVSVPVAQVTTAVVPTLLVAFGAYHFGSRGTVAVYDDGIEGQRQAVAYDDVAVAVRENHAAERLFGTATFRLFVPDSTSLTLRYVTDPDQIATLLETNLSTPGQQVAQAPADNSGDGDGPEYIEDRSQFWDYWRADEPLPESAVVDLDDLKRVMDVSALKVDRIDRVDMRGADRLSDIEKDDVTASSTHHNP